MKIKITLDSLCTDSVTVLTTRVFEENGEEYAFPPHARAYYNHAKGREQLEAELTEPYLSAVFAVWGNEPTLEYEEENE